MHVQPGGACGLESSRCLPILCRFHAFFLACRCGAGIQHEESLLRLKVHRSAAGIAEAICTKAADLGADGVLIASHGAGVLADFGSVARCAGAGEARSRRQWQR
jgi:hypothetical protein